MQQVGDTRLHAAAVPSLESRHQADVLGNGQVRQQPGFLDDVPRLAPKLDRVPLSRVASADQYVTRVRFEHPVHQFQRRRLARATAADERGDGAFIQRQGQTVEDSGLPVGETYISELDDHCAY